jgi:hypothetical protein
MTDQDGIFTRQADEDDDIDEVVYVGIGGLALGAGLVQPRAPLAPVHAEVSRHGQPSVRLPTYVLRSLTRACMSVYVLELGWRACG